MTLPFELINFHGYYLLGNYLCAVLKSHLKF